MQSKLGRIVLRTATVLFCAMITFFAPLSNANTPDKVRMAAILCTGPDEPYDGTFLRDWEKLAAEKPFGLELNKPRYTEGVYGDSAEAAMRVYARTKKYDIIWAHCSYSDQVKRIQKKYPNVLFVVTGSGNKGLGGNQYYLYNRVHEASYLLGMIAGQLTKTNTIGTVAAFPADDVNDVINGFVAGARSVNDKIKSKVTFIESWWDPPMAREASNAQIAAGADVIFQMSHAYEACIDKGIICLGNYKDWHSTAPTSVVSSSLADWRPHIRWIVEEWLNTQAIGKPMRGNTEPKWFTMAEGASALAPYHSFEDKLSYDLKAKVEETKQQIVSGEFVVPLDTSVPVSD